MMQVLKWERGDKLVAIVGQISFAIFGKMINIILLGKPISTQNAYAQHWKIKFMKKEAKEMKNSYILQTRLQYREKPILDPLEIKIKLFFWDKRIRDWDNWHKISMDALTGIVYDDDSQIKKALVEIMEVDKEKPRIEIIITPL